MKKSIILISSALLLIAGCAKEQLAEPAVQNEYDGPVTIVGATYEQYSPEGGTKASFDANGNFGWESSDAALFELIGDDSWASASAQDITPDKSRCTFTIQGTLSTDMVAVLPSDLSPERYNVESANDGLKVTIPASRTWVKDQSYATMIGFGTANGQSYTFSHLCGLAKVTVNGVPADARKFVFKTKGFKISGEFEAGKINSSGNQTISTAAANSTAIAVDDFEEDEETYSLTFTSNDISSNNEVMEFNVPLPCGTYSNGFAFCFKDEGGEVIYNFAGSAEKVITRAKRIILPTINIADGGGEGSKTIQNVPADHNGDFYLADAKNVLVNIPSGTNAEKTINFKYYGTKPEKLEIHVVDEATPGTYKGTISGNLSETHVDFTQGEIANVEMTTSASTFEIVQPAKISNKLTVTGGNVKVKGAQVAAIEVAANAVASEETKAPVQIVVDKANAQEFTAPAVTAKANVIVAPATGVEVKVTAEGQAKVANGGEGTVKDNNEQSITTKAAAKIGDIKYITLADAVKAAPANATKATTITLLENVTDGAGIFLADTDKKNIIIDMDGHSYTGVGPAVGSTGTSNQLFHIEKGNTFTLKNSDSNQSSTVSIDSEKANLFRFIIQNYADLTLEDVTIDGTGLSYNTDGKDYTYALSNNCGTVNLNGTTSIKASTTSGMNNYAFDVCKYASYDAPTVTWNSTGSVDGIIELSGGEFVVAKNLALTRPIRTNSKPAILTINQDATISQSGAFPTVHTKFTGDSESLNENNSGLVIVNYGGDLTIKGAGTIEATQGCTAAVCMTEKKEVYSNADAKLKVENVTLKGKGIGITGNGGRHNTVIVINNAKIYGTSTDETDEAVGLYHPQEGTLTINGSNTIIQGLASGVEMRAGTLTVNDGTIEGTATTYSVKSNGNGSTTVGAGLSVAPHTTGKNINVTINGGTFKGAKAFSNTNPEEQPSHVNITINGGTFSDEEVIKYAANGADINIALQANRNASGIFLGENKNVKVTFDLGGKTLNFKAPAVGSSGTENQAFHIEQGNQLFTLKNGIVTIDEGAKTAFRFIIQNYNDLTVDGVELDGTNLAYNVNDKVRYTVSNNQGTVNFTGNTTIKAAAENGIAFDVCKNGSYTAPTVTWASTGTVTGGIELSGGKFVVSKNLAVSVPVMAESGESILEIGSGATLSAADNFSDPNPLVKTKTATAPVQVKRGASLTINGQGTVGGTKTYSAVLVTVDGDEGETKTATLTVDGNVTLQGDYYGIAGNGSRHNTKITVNGGTIKGLHNNDNLGIYHPQEGTLTISGGTITGYSTAVELRAGTLSVTGGTLKSTADTYSCVKSDGGTTTVGAALAIAQHNTKKNINVTLSGGTFEGLRTVNVENPQNNDGANVSVSISGGTYNATDFAVFNNDARTTVSISDGEFKATNTASGRGIAVYARLGSVNITGGEFTNTSNSEATLHVGCPSVGDLQPTLTISGSSTVVKNNATGQYTHKTDWKPLCVNMANELTYKAVTITGGEFYGQKPECDDNVSGEYGKFVDDTNYTIIDHYDYGYYEVSANPQ